MSFLLPLIGPLLGAGLGSGLGSAAAKQGGVGALSGVPNGTPDYTKSSFGAMTGLQGAGAKNTSSGVGDISQAGNFFKTIFSLHDQNRKSHCRLR